MAFAPAAPGRLADKGNGMLLETTRFGMISVDESRAITFPKGLLGFPAYKRYVLIEPADNSYFW